MFFAALAAALPVFTSCEENGGPEATYEISVNLMYEGSAYEEEGITVSLSVFNGGASYEAATNASGTASFCVPAGTYEASASFRTAENGNVLTFNGVNSSVVVTASGETSFDIALTASETNQIVIKELYIGGCPTDDGSDYYQYDKYVVLYNNSSESATLSNLCLGMATPYNSNGTNNYYEGGSLIYSDWIPAACAIWWFQQDVTIEPYSQIVVALNGAIDHTATYSNSVDLSNSAYYATYDLECGFTNANYYPYRPLSPELPLRQGERLAAVQHFACVLHLLHRGHDSGGFRPGPFEQIPVQFRPHRRESACGVDHRRGGGVPLRV